MHIGISNSDGRRERELATDARVAAAPTQAGAAQAASEPSPHSDGALNHHSSAIPRLVTSPGQRGHGILGVPTAVTGRERSRSSGHSGGSSSGAAERA